VLVCCPDAGHIVDGNVRTQAGMTGRRHRRLEHGIQQRFRRHCVDLAHHRVVHQRTHAAVTAAVHR
jgi:hypothetical protein